MKKTLFIGAACIALGFIWGGATAAYRVFPYFQLRSLVIPQGRTPLQEEAQKLFERFPRKGDVVVAGDSILSELSWQDALPEHTVVQRTIGGSTSAHVRAGIEAIRSTGARYTILMVGTNDIARGIPMRETLANIAAVRDHVPGKLIVMSLPPCTVKDLNCIKRASKIRAMNDRLASMPGIEFADLRNTIGSDDIVDGIHLNAEGMAKVVNDVRRRLGDR